MALNTYLSSAFDLPMTYGQRLRQIMQDNHLTVSDLCRKLGYHSSTQLTRILNDEVSETLLTRFHRQFMLIFDWLISPAEIRALSLSLQFSCMGQDAFLTRRAMYRMLFDPPVISAESILLQFAQNGQNSFHTLSELIAYASSHQRIDLLILDSAHDRLLSLFTSLMKQDFSAEQLHIHHYFVMEDHASRLISQVSALVPFLNTGIYTGAYCTEHAQHAAHFIKQNPIALARIVSADQSISTTLFLSPQENTLPVCRLQGDDLYTFFEQMISSFQDQMRPIKSVYPSPKSAESLLTLCQRDLFMEQNHICCFIKLDFCFHMLPTQIVLEAVDNGARMGMTVDDPLMRELIRVHTARYDNLMTKREPTLFIFSRKALTDFCRTGHMSDHLFAMRDFTPAQRRAVLQPLIRILHENEVLSIHIIKDDALEPVGCFCAYEDLGIQISANNTAYNIAENHSEVFVGLPAFAQSFIDYCTKTLIPESCMTREESIDWLTQLCSSICDE